MFHLEYNYKRPNSLLTWNNAKTVKSEKFGIKTFIMYMSPHKQNTSGKNICPNATEGCAAACLFSAGHGKYDTVKLARLNRTEFFLREKEKFMQQLYAEILLSKVKHPEIAVRLNGTSDIPYENIPINGFKNIFEAFPDVKFYDYTKSYKRLLATIPENYYLVFSRAETEKNQKEAALALGLGYSIAVVFGVDNPENFPKTYLGYEVVNGDGHDFLYKHPKNVVIGLTAKGKAKKDKSGFVVRDF